MQDSSGNHVCRRTTHGAKCDREIQVTSKHVQSSHPCPCNLIIVTSDTRIALKQYLLLTQQNLWGSICKGGIHVVTGACDRSIAHDACCPHITNLGIAQVSGQ